MAFSLKRAVSRFLRILTWVFLLVVASSAVLIAVIYFSNHKPFNKERWDKADLSSDGDERCGYANDLINHKLIAGKTTKAEVMALLGEGHEEKTYACDRALTYYLGFCSLMDGHTLDVCLDQNDVVTKVLNVQH